MHDNYSVGIVLSSSPTKSLLIKETMMLGQGAFIPQAVTVTGVELCLEW
jgi:hypothetical protein